MLLLLQWRAAVFNFEISSLQSRTSFTGMARDRKGALRRLTESPFPFAENLYR